MISNPELCDMVTEIVAWQVTSGNDNASLAEHYRMCRNRPISAATVSRALSRPECVKEVSKAYDFILFAYMMKADDDSTGYPPDQDLPAELKAAAAPVRDQFLSHRFRCMNVAETPNFTAGVTLLSPLVGAAMSGASPCRARMLANAGLAASKLLKSDGARNAGIHEFARARESVRGLLEAEPCLEACGDERIENRIQGYAGFAAVVVGRRLEDPELVDRGVDATCAALASPHSSDGFHVDNTIRLVDELRDSGGPAEAWVTRLVEGVATHDRTCSWCASNSSRKGCVGQALHRKRHMLPEACAILRDGLEGTGPARKAVNQ